MNRSRRSAVRYGKHPVSVLQQFCDLPGGQQYGPVFDYFFRVLHSGVPALKGIIIDLRGNGGGEISDLDLLVGQLTTSEYTFGYTRYKNGVNRLDYSPWAPAVVKPWVGGAVNVTVPIVVLADHLSVSMSEITTMAIKNPAKREW